MSDIISVLASNISAANLRTLKTSGCVVVRLFSSGGHDYHSVTGPRDVVSLLTDAVVLSPVNATDVLAVRTSGRPVGSKTMRVPANSPNSE